MLPDSADITFPKIEAARDDELWLPPSVPSRNGIAPGAFSVHGMKGMRSTVFHHSAKLGCLLRDVLDTMFAFRSRGVIHFTKR